jgi:hypothetical protein
VFHRKRILEKSEKNIMVCTMRHCFQGPAQKGNITLIDLQVKKNKIRMVIPVRVYLMGCRETDHMTNYQKWSKNESCSSTLCLLESV